MVKQITARQLLKRIQEQSKPPLLLDVREPSEFDHANIEGSLLMPMSSLLQHFDELDKQQQTVVICHHGMRSQHVADYLVNIGFQDVFNLVGGIEAWTDYCNSAVSR